MFKSFLVIGISASALAATGAGAVTFAYTGAVQNYTVASAGIYALRANGAQGGSSNNQNGSGLGGTGYGAAVGRTLTIGANTLVNIAVGGAGGGTASLGGGGGGGGGTFIRLGSQPVLVAGGGGGDGELGYAGGASLGTDGQGAGGGGGGVNGSGGPTGYGYSSGAGGGAGVSSSGTNGSTGACCSTRPGFPGGGGRTAPSFAGGSGSASTNSGGFGGGGGGSGDSGGGGGGYSGGAGAADARAGGGGGSYGNDSTFAAAANHLGDGSATIDALRYFAVASVSGTLDFGVVRGGSATQHRSVTIANTVIAGPISDTLQTNFLQTPAAIIGSRPKGVLAAGQSLVVDYSLSSSTAGLISADARLGFTSRSATDGDIALRESTFHVTGTVTDLAVAVIVGKGDGLLTFKNGHYVLDLGDVAANSGMRSTLVSMLNGVKASDYSEVLTAYYSGLSSDGFSLALHNPFNAAQQGDPVMLLGDLEKVAGGEQAELGLLGFDPTGLSLGLHSQTIDFYAFSEFGTLRGIGGSDFPITVEANVTAGVPVAGVPEPATWGLLTAGFGMIGAAMRRRKSLPA